MVQRSRCLYNGNIIGIESIYTAINGKQINIADKVEKLRELGRKELLFCPCGCGANLILVAGDKNLKEQHFRMKHSDIEHFDCKVVEEGEESLNAKIALKCWFEDKLGKQGLECEVPVRQVNDSYRKYEYTVYEPENNIGVCYWRDRANISDDKISILEKYTHKVIYIVGGKNERFSEQYPEYMMKIQKTQGYNMYLSIDSKESVYESAVLSLTYNIQNIDGEWEELSVASDLLTNFDIKSDGFIIYNGLDVESILQGVINGFHSEQNKIHEYRIKKEQERRLLEQQREVERLRREKEWKEQQEKIRIENLKKQEEIKKQAEEEKRKQELEAEDKVRRQKEFESNLEELLSQQELPVIDTDGNRWFKCKYCGKTGKEKLFWSYGGPEGKNTAICYDCTEIHNKVRQEQEELQRQERQKQRQLNKQICPICGRKMVLRTARKGPKAGKQFYGCSGFPRCDYSIDV